MKVYIVYGWVVYEGITKIDSVHYSEEKARHKADQLNIGLDPEWVGYNVNEYEVVE